jgi:hypothetical protein
MGHAPGSAAPGGPEMRRVVQVLFGLALCVAVAVCLTYSSLPFFWERGDPQPHVYTITWRSGLVFLVLLAAAQWVSVLIFRRIFGKRRV